MIELCKYLVSLSAQECWGLFFMFLGLSICIRTALPIGDGLINLKFGK